MLCFVQQLLYYCTSEVIEPNWAGFMLRLENSRDEEAAGRTEGGAGADSGVGRDKESGFAVGGGPDEKETKKVKRTVDELMQDHVDFLATCLKECMLTNSKLLKVSAHPRILSSKHWKRNCCADERYSRSMQR